MTRILPNLFLRKQTFEEPQATHFPESWTCETTSAAGTSSQVVLNTCRLKFIREKVSMLEISFPLECTITLSKNLSIAYNCWKAS